MNTIKFILLGIGIGVSFWACKKGEKKENQLPDTIVTPAQIELQGKLRLKSSVRLSWIGTDIDGYVKGYEFSKDGTTWHYTTKTDSTFIFDISEGSDTIDIHFQVRAIDDKNAKDNTPAQVIVPIKNTPPTVLFNKTLSTSDTAYIVATIFWDGDDADGLDNLKTYHIKANDGNWTELPKNISNISIVPNTPDQLGQTSAKLYQTSANSIAELDGIKMGDTNSIYIKVKDLSGSESLLDTISQLFFKPKASDLLVIGGDRDKNSFYKSHLSNVYPKFDYIDYTANSGKNQPSFWDPTFTLLIKQYDKLFIYSDKTTYINSNTKKESLILESSANSVQEFINDGGKSFTIGYFENPLSPNSNLYNIYPMQSVDETSKSVLLEPKSNSLTPKVSGYPDLGTTSFPSSITPFQKTTDAVEIYEGVIDRSLGYNGPGTLGAKRVLNNKTYQVFIAAAMNDLDHDYDKVDSLFNHVLNVEFNW